VLYGYVIWIFNTYTAEIDMSTIPSAAVTTATSTAKAVSSSGLLGSTSTTGGNTQNQFLNLLVAEMQNQDPTNPLSSADMVTQMAQIANVTAMNSMNSSIQGLDASYQSSQALQAASLIGHQVLAPGSALQLSNGSASFGVDLSAAADSVQVSIMDASGNTVHSVNLGAQSAGVTPLQWDGVTDAGTAAAAGTYTFSVTATAAGKAVQSTALAYGKLQSVSTDASGINVNVSGVGNVPLSNLYQII